MVSRKEHHHQTFRQVWNIKESYGDCSARMEERLGDIVNQEELFLSAFAFNLTGFKSQLSI